MRATHAEVAERVDRLAHALTRAGRRATATASPRSPGTPSATSRCYLAAPCMGAVLHTLNIRLFAEQLTYIVNHAQDKVILVDASLVPVLEKLAPSFETVEHYVVMGDGDPGSLPERRSTTRSCSAAQEPGFDYPELDERAGRRPLLHERHDRQPEGRPVLAPLERPARDGRLPGRRDGVCRATTACCRSSRCSTPTPGACPTRRRSPAPTSSCPAASSRPSRSRSLIESERVTLAGAVPTIWLDLLRYADEHKPDLSIAAHAWSAAAPRSRARSCRPSRSATACTSSRPGG